VLPCKLNPRSASIRATVRSLTRCQGLVNASARFRVDFVVQTSSDIGSPRVSGSTKALSCNNNPGSDSARLFRPPPGARTRTAGSASPANSRTPRAIVSGCTPVAAATTLIPPLPNSCASAPRNSRRYRSSMIGELFAKGIKAILDKLGLTEEQAAMVPKVIEATVLELSAGN